MLSPIFTLLLFLSFIFIPPSCQFFFLPPTPKSSLRFLFPGWTGILSPSRLFPSSRAVPGFFRPVAETLFPITGKPTEGFPGLPPQAFLAWFGDGLAPRWRDRGSPSSVLFGLDSVSAFCSLLELFLSLSFLFWTYLLLFTV